MSKKRSKTVASRTLRSVIDDQLTAAAQEIFRLLQERPESDPERLKQLVAERVAAAVDVIFSVFHKLRGGKTTQEPGESPQKLPKNTRNAGITK